MAQSYTRQSTFADGDTITAALFNNEYNQLVNAFTYSSSSASSTGHRHDGTAGHGGNIHTIGDLDFLNKIVADSTNNRWGFFVQVSSSAVEQIRLSDGVLAPVTDSDVDLGTSSLYWKDAYIDSITTTGNVAIGGNLTVTGNATIAGNLTFGDAASDTVAFSADVASNLLPSADNTYDIGASGSEWKDLYIDGTANIDSLVADTADINGGTVDGAIIGGSSAAAITGTAITGTSFVIGSADINEAELETIDGVTAGTVAASKAVVVDSNKDIGSFRNITLTGELDAGSLDVSGDADIDGTLETDALSINGTTVTSTAAELNILDGVTSTAAELNILDGVTSTAAELNILDGVTATAAEINALDGITSTVAELNILDGVTASATDINLIDGITNGTVIASKAIITDSNKDITGGRNITISGELDAATLDISGDADIDGTLEADAITIGGVTLAETISDTVGAMVGSNTETNITVTYEDSDNTLDFVIGTLNQDTTGNAATFTATANNSTDETVYPIFVDGATGSQGAETDTGLTYNPSTGMITTTGVTATFTGNITGNVTGNTSGTAATVTGAAQSNITSLGTLTTLTVDNVIVNGTTIGHTSDTDLITLADGNVTIAGELDLTTLDVSGNADIDGTLEADAYTVNGTNLDEYIEDTVGAMLSSNTETGIAVTYQDGDSTIDFALDAAQTGITSLLATDIKIGEDDQTKIDFETADEIHFFAANAEQVYVADGIFGPQTDSDVDLGSTSVRWKDAYIDSVTTTGNASIGGNLTLTGNLVVNGTTTTVNSTTVTIDDPIFTLGGDSAPGSDDNKDRGIEFRWHNGSAAKLGFFGYDDSASAFTFVPDASNSSEVFSGTVGNAIFGDITGTLQTAAQANITSLGTLTALTGGTGDFNWDSNTLVVDSSVNRVGILNASPDVTLDIGSATDAVHMPTGNTAQRPGSPAAGYFRYNSETAKFEGYTDEWGSIAGGGSGTNMDTNIYAGDGSDTTFTLSTAPDTEQNLMVFIDGVFQAHDSYSVSGTTLTFSTAPANGRVITAYHSTTTVGGSNNTINTMTGDGSDTTLTLSVAPVHENNVQVYFDGVYQSKANYSISGTTLTFSTAPPDDVLVEAITNTNTSSTTANKLLDADGDTQIQVEESSDEDKIRFDIAGTEEMVMDATGIVINDGSNDRDFRIESNGNANMLFVDGGNDKVAIGSATANKLFNLADPDQGGEALKLHFEANSGSDKWGIYSYDRTNGHYADLSLGQNAVYIKGSDASVGIGTSSPAAELHVSAATTTQIRCESTTNSSTSTLQLATNGSDWNLSAGGSAQGTYPNGFYIYDAGSDATRLVIDSAGRLLLGNSSVVAHANMDDLQVGAGSGSVGINIYSGSGTGNYGTLAFGDGSGAASYRGFVEYHQGDDSMRLGTSALERMRIDSSGNLLIAATSFSGIDDSSVKGIALRATAGRSIHTIDSGANAIEFNTHNNGNAGEITCTGTSTAYSTSSDYRLKDVKDSIQNGLERTLALNPVEFEWKADGRMSEGFIAHEAQEIFPDAVNGEKDGEKMQSMDYGRITPLLVKAIQEQQEQIEELKQQINELREN